MKETMENRSEMFRGRTSCCLEGCPERFLVDYCNLVSGLGHSRSLWGGSSEVLGRWVVKSKSVGTGKGSGSVSEDFHSSNSQFSVIWFDPFRRILLSK